ncbi:hypothetical protein LNJ02_02255, partial [Tenacibaculum finnmarkense genomovar ulcerans]|nr:hypothetical protein [Tenacibaculum finnmarkense genomovar ulcerans]
RPIYFTGGANADEEYIWLKDYLQLDGMSYKFVPIKTSNKGKSIMSMGRIDTKKMYDNVKKWNWKTINNGKIYLDEQSKRNAISIRNNLMRLSEEYLKEGDSVNAKDVLDLSLYKLPIKQFEHYSVSLEYPELYYRMGDIEKAHETVETLIDVFQQKLKYYSTFKDQDVDLIIDNLETSLYMYQNLIQQITKYDNDMEYGKKAFEAYLNHANLFKHLMANEPQQPVRELDTIKP